MAKERQTNININYKVSTVDIEKGNQLLSRASAATDNLRKATGQYTQQAATGYKFTSKAIEGMEIEVARLRQQVKLQSTQNTADISKLSNAYKSAKAQLDAYKKSLLDVGKATKDNSAANKEMASSFGQVITAVKTFIGFQIAKELVDISLNMAKLAGNVEGVERAFNRAFPNASQVLDELRKATHGTVDDFELMQRTLQATNFGLSVEKLPVLFEFAATRAQQTGESVDYLVDSIVRGIGMKSILRLDNLGLSATRLKEQFQGASLASQSIADVTEGVSKIAGEELKKMGGFLETTATLVDQNTVAWKELNKEAAKFFTEGGGSGTIKLMKEYADTFRLLFRTMNEGKSAHQIFNEDTRKQIALMSMNEFETRRLTGSKEENTIALQENIDHLKESIGSWAGFREEMEKFNAEDQKELDILKQSFAPNQDKIIQLAQQITHRKSLIEANKEDVLIDQEILKLMELRLVALTKINEKEEEQLGLIEEVQEEIEKLEDKIKKSRSPQQIATLNQQLEITKGVLNDLHRLGLPDFSKDLPKSTKAIKDATKELMGMAGIMTQVMNRFEESMEKPLQIPELPTITGMTFGEKLGEAFAENWRNVLNSGLEDSANFLIELKNQEVDALQTQIAHLREFYDEQQLLAGNNERAKTELKLKEEKETNALRRRLAEKEKQASLFAVKISTAIAIVKALATSVTIYDGFVNAAIAAAQGAAQLIAINRATPRFAKGVIDLKGPGSKTSDSIPSLLSRGESVMTADETASSKGIFKAVRARKLNDKVLQEIVSGRSGGTVQQKADYTPILKKLDEVKNSQPDLVEQGGLLYKSYDRGNGLRRRIRAKSISG